jgi:hypothetical protein
MGVVFGAMELSLILVRENSVGVVLILPADLQFIFG